MGGRVGKQLTLRWWPCLQRSHSCCRLHWYQSWLWCYPSRTGLLGPSLPLHTTSLHTGRWWAHPKIDLSTLHHYTEERSAELLWVFFRLTRVLSKSCMTWMLATWQSSAQDTPRRQRATTYHSILLQRRDKGPRHGGHGRRVRGKETPEKKWENLAKFSTLVKSDGSSIKNTYLVLGGHGGHGGLIDPLVVPSGPVLIYMQRLCNEFCRSDPPLLPRPLTLVPLVHKNLQNNFAMWCGRWIFCWIIWGSCADSGNLKGSASVRCSPPEGTMVHPSIHPLWFWVGNFNLMKTLQDVLLISPTC